MSIPQTIQASRAIAHAEKYEGDLSIAHLKRLAASTGDAGPAARR
jgi:hypothetical protein